MRQKEMVGGKGAGETLDGHSPVLLRSSAELVRSVHIFCHLMCPSLYGSILDYQYAREDRRAMVEWECVAYAMWTAKRIGAWAKDGARLGMGEWVGRDVFLLFFTPSAPQSSFLAITTHHYASWLISDV
ncbi:hypothetical protein BT69DRAFT_50879 [Atractiella rhizophila]|nr:hypothetical protein BT69DRAFT_50879 [Atractiella rhizophila]